MNCTIVGEVSYCYIVMVHAADIAWRGSSLRGQGINAIV